MEGGVVLVGCDKSTNFLRDGSRELETDRVNSRGLTEATANEAGSLALIPSEPIRANRLKDLFRSELLRIQPAEIRDRLSPECLDQRKSGHQRLANAECNQILR